MEKNKQIEEISKILTDAAHKACEDIPFAPPNLDYPCISPNVECHRCKEARALIDAGYRKQSEEELVDKIATYFEKEKNWTHLKDAWLINGRSEALRKMLRESLRESLRD